MSAPCQFLVRHHTITPERQTVEVLDANGRVVAVIYPHPKGLRVVSAFYRGAIADPGADIADTVPPGVLVVLDCDR